MIARVLLPLHVLQLALLLGVAYGAVFCCDVVICWNPRERRLIALPTADHASADSWIRQTRTAARVCLPDEPSFVSP